MGVELYVELFNAFSPDGLGFFMAHGSWRGSRGEKAAAIPAGSPTYDL